MFDNRYKFIVTLLLLALVFSLFTVFIYSSGDLSVSARSAALYEPKTKSFLYTKNPNERLPMASTTKIMTALLALEHLSPSEEITVDSRAVGIEGSSIYLKSGERMCVLDLIYSVMLQSANDAAAALAYKIADGIDKFANLMNEKARSLGLYDTNFTNPHGLDDKNHYTTAHDLAIISAAALENETFREISATYKKAVSSSETERLLVNHNKMLKSYDGCIGVKTGYTKKSGRSLVSAADRDGLTLVSVTINAPDDWRDHTKMLDYGYSLLVMEELASPGQFSFEIPILGGDAETVKVSNKDRLTKILEKESSDFVTEIHLSRYFSAPINKGDVLGAVIFKKDGEEIARLDLLAENTVKAKTNKKRWGLFPI